MDKERDSFVEEFKNLVLPEPGDVFNRWDGHLDSFGLDGDNAAVQAEALVTFRGRRYSFRRRIWPPQHPVVTQAAIFVTVLEEKLLVRAVPADVDSTEPVVL